MDKQIPSTRKLKRKLMTALLALLIAFMAMASATFAWYIYNTSAHTTSVHMAAGSSASIKISSAYEGPYSTSATLEKFVGTLNPVSTDKILGGFQKVYGFTNGSENQPTLVANLFGPSATSDYYKTSLFLRTDGDEVNVYLSNIGYEDSDSNNPISTAIRVGLVTHQPGQDQPTDQEFIFAINQAENPKGEYNTIAGEEGYVLDSSKRNDGTQTVLAGDTETLIEFSPYTPDNYCEYDSETGAVTVTADSKKLCTITGDGTGHDGTPVQVDVYIWLEGCDEDCTDNLCMTTLKNVALSFSGSVD